MSMNLCIQAYVRIETYVLSFVDHPTTVVRFNTLSVRKFLLQFGDFVGYNKSFFSIQLFLASIELEVEYAKLTALINMFVIRIFVGH